MRNAIRYNDSVAIGVAPDANDIAQLSELGYRTLIDLRDPKERFGGAIAVVAKKCHLETVEIPIQRTDIRYEDVQRFYRVVFDAKHAPVYAFSRMGKKPLAFLLLYDAVVGNQPLSWIFRQAARMGVDLRGDMALQQFLVDLYNTDCGAQIVGEFLAPSTVPKTTPHKDTASEAPSAPPDVASDQPVSRAERQQMLRQRGFTVWFTGLPASGKTTTACALDRELVSCGYLTYVLDAEVLRTGLCFDLGFSAEARGENIRRAAEVAKTAADIGAIALACFISPYRKDRLAAREIHEAAGLPFVEVFVDTPLSECKKRDPKGLYRKAELGEIPEFTGVSDPYEPPVRPDLVVRTHQMAPHMIAREIMQHLAEADLL